MAHGIVIVVFILAGLAAAMGPEAAKQPWPWVAAFAWPVVGGVLLAATTARAARRLDRIGDLGSLGLVQIAQSVYVIVGIAAYAVAMLLFGWLAAVQKLTGDIIVIDELLAALPVAMLLTVSFAARYPIDRRLSEASLIARLDRGEPIHAEPGWLGSIVLQWRHQVLFLLVPLVLISVWVELSAGYAASAGWSDLHAGAVQLLGTLAIFAASPLALRFVWDTVMLRDGELHDTLAAMARTHRVRLSGVLIWRTRGTIVNAAVTGLLPVLRYVVLSDGLLDRMPARQVEAVAAHEIAHVRKRHLAWMAGLVIAVVTVVGLPMDLIVMRLDDPWAVPSQLIAAGVTLAVTLLALGMVSRRFEWQADAFAVRHIAMTHGTEPGVIDQDSVLAMTGALGRVARYGGVSPGRFTFRHGSIADRQRRLRALLGAQVDRLPIDARIARLKIVIAAGLVLAGGVIAADVLVPSETPSLLPSD